MRRLAATNRSWCRSAMPDPEYREQSLRALLSTRPGPRLRLQSGRLYTPGAAAPQLLNTGPAGKAGLRRSRPGRQQTLDESGGPSIDGFSIERRGVDQYGIGCGREWCCFPAAVAGVARLKIAQNRLEGPGPAPLSQLLAAALGARRDAGGDIELQRRIRADDSADIAAIQHGTRASIRRVGGETALEVEQGRAHRRMGGHDRRRAPHILVTQARLGEAGRSERSRRAGGSIGIGRVETRRQHVAPDGTIECSSVEVGKVEPARKSPRQRPLARGGRPVDGDDEGQGHAAGSIAAPNRRISPAKSGKLVSIVAPSSISTGVSAARPRTRKAMAMR